MSIHNHIFCLSRCNNILNCLSIESFYNNKGFGHILQKLFLVQINNKVKWLE